MRLAWAAAILAGFAGAPANAFECPPRNLIYESAGSAGETIRFTGSNLELTKGGQKQVYQTSGSADSNVKAARLASETDAPKLEFFMVDVSRMASAQEPDHLLIFDKRPFWPTCRN